MTIHFTKMEGLGNDFVVIDAIRQPISLSSKQIAALANRNTGIGFDQCLIVEPSRETGIDFFYRIFNADGHEVGQCGNGVRCLARFLSYYGLSNKNPIRVATHTTKMQLQLHDDETVTVEMGLPMLEPSAIPIQAKQQAPLYSLSLPDGSIQTVHALSVGNPHAVSLVSDLNNTAVGSLGKQISEHALFPEQANAGFMQIIDTNHIRLRVYERGCGETLACGSGAVAAAAIGRLYYKLAQQISVNLPGGELIVNWPDIKGPIYLRGPARFVYEGKLLAHLA